jgi:S1-C subfamily serine protease
MVKCPKCGAVVNVPPAGATAPAAAARPQSQVVPPTTKPQSQVVPPSTKPQSQVVPPTKPQSQVTASPQAPRPPSQVVPPAPPAPPPSKVDTAAPKADAGNPTHVDVTATVPNPGATAKPSGFDPKKLLDPKKLVDAQKIQKAKDFVASKKKLLPWVLAGVGVVGLGGLLFIVVIGVVIYKAVSKKSDPALLAQAPEDAPKPKRPPEQLPPRAEIPEGPVPAQLDAAAMRKVKDATVYLRVSMPNGGVAEGTGFFGLEPGIVFTNAHVLGMLRAESAPPSQVEAVLHSGEAGERKLVGTVLAVDRNNDLAILRMPTDAANLPNPLPVDTATKLFETQKVYIFGFPLGEQLGKNITVSESSVSSLRRDATGLLAQVQVNGGMHPGNSGGPVTDARGVVVGVSVSGYSGTQINFAIPGDFVPQVLDGQFSKHEVGRAYRSGTKVMLPVQVSCMDPLNRVREVRVEVWAGRAGKDRPASTEKPTAQEGDGDHGTYEATLREGMWVAAVPLPEIGAGQACWIRPVLENAIGSTRWHTATTVPADLQTPLEYQPALLTFKPPTAAVERSLHMVSDHSVTLYQGKNSTKFGEKMDGSILESLNPDPRGTGTSVRLTLGKCPFTREIGSRAMGSPPQIQSILSQFSPTFLVDATHACRERGIRNFNVIRAEDDREIVSNMFETVCNTFESTTLPLPNRMMQPLEAWQTRMPMLVTLRGKRQVQDVHVTCTYEGVRTVDGHNEAFILLVGEVKSRSQTVITRTPTGNRTTTTAGQTLGKAKGEARFDIERGYLTYVNLSVISEVESEESGLRVLVNNQSTVTRREGNQYGLKAATQNQPGGVAPPPIVRPPVRPPIRR